MITILILISNIWFGGDIKNLGSDDFHTRHALTEKLYGTTKGFWLSICTRNNDDPEIRFRGELIFRKRKFGHETLIVYQALTTFTFNSQDVVCSRNEAAFWIVSPDKLEVLKNTAIKIGRQQQGLSVTWEQLGFMESIEKAVRTQITGWRLDLVDSEIFKGLPKQYKVVYAGCMAETINKIMERIN